MTGRTRAGLRVPDANAYTGELIDYPLTFAWDAAAGAVRLGYLDPKSTDWRLGVLWARHGQDRKGRHTWRVINALRQRRAMMRHLCMVCGEPATDEDGRIWWLFHTDPDVSPDGAPISNIPPTCQKCIPESLATCPPLRKRSRVCTAVGSSPFAVTADLYMPAPDHLSAIRAVCDVNVTLDMVAILRFCLAKQLWVSLHDLRDEPFLRRSNSTS